MRYEILHLVRVVLVLVLLAYPISVISTADVASSPYIEKSTPALYAPTDKEEYCLTQAIYYEAGNQSILGKEAVAWVVLNRVGRPGYPKTVCGVIAQSSKHENTKVCQFSFWCENRYKPNKVLWNESNQIAKRVLKNVGVHAIIDQYGDATYYHADYVRPKWRKTKEFLGKIENHLFYREPKK
jgi:spore germination cell wall hydrolase CwlJ-like protein